MINGKGERFVWLRKVWEEILGPDIENRILRARSNYLGMLRLIDDQFKRLVEGVRERGLEEDTIILYLSDMEILQGIWIEMEGPRFGGCIVSHSFYLART